MRRIHPPTPSLSSRERDREDNESVREVMGIESMWVPTQGYLWVFF